MSEGIQKVVGLTIFAALIVLGIVASDTDGQTTTRNAAIPMLNMDGEEEPPPPSDKALAKLEDKVNEMGEMILEIASQVENLTPGEEGSPGGLEEIQSQVFELVQELRLTNTRINSVQAEAIIRVAGCTKRHGSSSWSCELRANFYGASLPGANLSNASLTESNFNGAHLAGTNFSGAALRGAYFEDADLSDADFMGAALDDASFSRATLDGTDFTGARGLDMNSNQFWRADLTGAIGLP